VNEYERRQADEEQRRNAPEKVWYCRECRVEAVTKGPPPGWYSLKTVTGGDNPKSNGLVCSVPCLAATVSNLETRLKAAKP
jgi:hypothetical protein